MSDPRLQLIADLIYTRPGTPHDLDCWSECEDLAKRILAALDYYQPLWKQELIQFVNTQIPADVPNESMGSIQAKIKRIVTIRNYIDRCPARFPEIWAGGLAAQKHFVEENWA